MGYKFKIENKQGKYYFYLYPNNNNSQQIGHSKEFLSEIECTRSLREFKKMIMGGNKDFSLSITIDSENNRFFPCIRKGSEILFIRDNPYVHKNECNKWLDRIIKNIDAENKQ